MLKIIQTKTVKEINLKIQTNKKCLNMSIW